MVGRPTLVLRHQGAAAEQTQLLGMAFDGDAQCRCGLKQFFGLCKGKADVFTKHIHTFKQAFLPQCGHDVIDDHLQIIVGTAFVFWRNRMGRKQGAAHGDVVFFTQFGGNLQTFALIFQIQAIARFDFNQAHAFVHVVLQTLFAQCIQIRRRAVTGGAYRGIDATASGADGLVRLTVLSAFPFACAAAAKHQMGVAVDEAGRDEAFV